MSAIDDPNSLLEKVLDAEEYIRVKKEQRRIEKEKKAKEALARRYAWYASSKSEMNRKELEKGRKKVDRNMPPWMLRKRRRS